MNVYNSRKYLRILALSFIILAFLLLLENRYPYFFLQDDNRDSYLPNFVHCFRSLKNGELAIYNFHQFSGISALAGGQNGTLYLPVYIAVFLSQLIFGHFFATIDILVILYCIIGAIGIYQFVAMIVDDWKVAFFAGIVWPLSSFVIYVSDSWVVFAALAAYFPWMLYFSFQMYRMKSIKWMILGTIARLLLFYVGNVQIFIYAVIFEFFAAISYVIYDAKERNEKIRILNYVVKYIKSYVLVFLLSLPLLLPMWHQTETSGARSGKLDLSVVTSQYYPIDQLLKGLFFPFTQVDESTSFGFRNLVNLSHIGYIPVLLVIIIIMVKFCKKKSKIAVNGVRFSVFVRPLLLSFIWTSIPGFGLLIYCIPILNRFRWAFKIAFFLDFFLIIVAAMALAYIVKKIRWKAYIKNIALVSLVLIQLFNYGFLYLGTTYKDFGEHHGDAVPFEEPLLEEFGGGRIISLGFDIWDASPQNNKSYLTAPTMGFNYATLWGLDYFAGYDILVSPEVIKATLGLNFTAIWNSNQEIPVNTFRKSGVKWYLVPIDKAEAFAEKLEPYGIVEKYRDANRVVLCDEKASPMVYISSNKKQSIDYEETANTLEIKVKNNKPETILFNYTFNTFFEAYVDGVKTKIIKTEDNKISIDVQSGKHIILIKYVDPYFLCGMYIALGALFAIAIGLIVRKKYISKKSLKILNFILAS